MDGTRVTPERYTGRLGFPLFEELGQVVILRVPVDSGESASENAAEVDNLTGEDCYRQLSRQRYGAWWVAIRANVHALHLPGSVRLTIWRVGVSRTRMRRNA